MIRRSEQLVNDQNRKLKTLIIVVPLVLIIVFLVLYYTKKPAMELAKLQTENSVEVVFDSTPLDDTAYVISTTKKIFYKNALIKEQVIYDTVPYTGSKTELVEEEGGERKIKVPNEYEFFITVK